MYVVARKDYLISKGKTLSLDDALKLPLVVFSPSFQNETFMEGALRSFPGIHIKFDTNNMDLLKQAILHGKGIGIFTKRMIEKLFAVQEKNEKQNIRLIQIKDNIQVEYCIIAKKTENNQLVKQAFIDHTQKYFNQ